MMYSIEKYEELIKTYDFKQLLGEQSNLETHLTSSENNNVHIEQNTDYQAYKEHINIIKNRLINHFPEQYIEAIDDKKRQSEISYLIDRVIKKVWLNNIVRDYLNHNLLREDSLKCAFYYHLRRNLAWLIKKYNIRIYPEFYVKELNYRADIAIVQVDLERKVKDWKDSVTEVFAILELKFLSGNIELATNAIKKDILKIKNYKKILSNTQFYCVALYEGNLNKFTLLSKRSTNNWADGCVTVLKAHGQNGYEWFEIESCNNMNKDLNT